MITIVIFVINAEVVVKKYLEHHLNGFCTDCGNVLILYEKGRSRFVYCSNKTNCDFNISEDNLTKKFSHINMPDEIIGYSSQNYGTNFLSNNDIEDDDLPF